MKFDKEEFLEEKRRNLEEKLKFIDLYVEWLKKTPNEVWSRKQNELIDIAKKERGGEE